MAEDILLHTYVLTNIECIFSGKSFSLRNLSLLTNFQKLSTVQSNGGQLRLDGSPTCFVWLFCRRAE